MYKINLIILFSFHFAYAFSQGNGDWPVDDPIHMVDGSYSSFETDHQHLGIDIPGTPFFTKVVAICPVRIKYIQKTSLTKRSLLIWLQPIGSDDYIRYEHCEEDPNGLDLYNNDYEHFEENFDVIELQLNQGFAFATIANHTEAITSFDHTHVDYREDEFNNVDPLSKFADNDPQHPIWQRPQIGPLFVYKQDGSAKTSFYENAPVYGNVNISVQVIDNMGDFQFNEVSTPDDLTVYQTEQMPYVYRKGIVSTPLKVKYSLVNTTGIVIPERVIDFDGPPKSDAEMNLIYDENLRAFVSSTLYAERRYCYRLTNIGQSNVITPGVLNTETLQDGDYTLRINAADRVGYSIYPKDYILKIDNLLPYIKEVDIRTATSNTVVYHANISYDSGSGDLVYSNSVDLQVDDSEDLNIYFTFSEPMDQVTIHASNNIVVSAPTPAQNNTVWQSVIYKTQLSNALANGINDFLFTITGKDDLFQHDLYAFGATDEFRIYPKRDQSGAVFSNSIIEDERHKITFSKCPGTGQKSLNCMDADFSVSDVAPLKNNEITFTDISIGIHNPILNYWEFGDGTTASGSSASHTYSASGYYTVMLRISDGVNTDIETKHDYIFVRENSSTPIIDFTTNNTIVHVNEDITFMNTSQLDQNKVYYYNWDFGDNTIYEYNCYAGDITPITHIYTEQGLYTVKLSTCEVIGSTLSNCSEKIKTNYISVISDNYQSIISCISYPYLVTSWQQVFFEGYINYGYDFTKNYKYTYFFGDGQSSSATVSLSSNFSNHTYSTNSTTVSPYLKVEKQLASGQFEPVDQTSCGDIQIINTNLDVDFNISPSTQMSIYNMQPVSLTANVSGGLPPYFYFWEIQLPDNSNLPSSPDDYLPQRYYFPYDNNGQPLIGFHDIKLTVFDSWGAVGSQSKTLHIYQPPGSFDRCVNSLIAMADGITLPMDQQVCIEVRPFYNESSTFCTGYSWESWKITNLRLAVFSAIYPDVTDTDPEVFLRDYDYRSDGFNGLIKYFSIPSNLFSIHGGSGSYKIRVEAWNDVNYYSGWDSRPGVPFPCTCNIFPPPPYISHFYDWDIITVNVVDCNTTENLQNNSFSGLHTAGSIYVANATVNSGDNLHLQAYNEIVIDNSFDSGTNTEFIAEYIPCTTNGYCPQANLKQIPDTNKKVIEEKFSLNDNQLSASEIIHNDTRSNFYFKAFPNPFSNSTNLMFNIEESFVTIELYNIYGQKNKTVFNGFAKTGDYNIELETSDLSCGVYLCTYKTAERLKTIKLIKTK